MKLKILSLIILLILGSSLFFAFSGCSSGGGGGTTEWHEIARWEGESIKNTETFHIPSREWRISWSTKPGKYGVGNFQIFVYESDGSPVSIVANVIGENKDSSFMRGSGDYYLAINTDQPYLVIVEAKY